MKVIRDKTIEEMALDGYRPILGAVIMFSEVELGKKDPPEERLLERIGDEAQDMYDIAYSCSNMTADAFVVKTRMINSRDSLRKVESGTKQVMIGDRKFFVYPVLAYVKDQKR
jgi:hypothetical protein